MLILEIILFGAFLYAVLIYLAIKDSREMILPDIATLPLVAVGLFFASRSGMLTDGLIGAAVGYVAFVAIEKGYRAVRGVDGLGRGDAKLAAAGGAWCGWAALPHIVLIASMAGLAYALFAAWSDKKGQDAGAPIGGVAIAFGPHLALAIGLRWLMGRILDLPL
ncbi:MAG: A24 family peptidase [Pseudomonadota bacterium]